MAFCTQCGATVAGAFCNQCGTRVGETAAPTTSATPAATPATRKTSPIVWVLIGLLGLFGLGTVAVIGAGAFFVHKVKQAGVDSEMWRSNPGLAVEKLLTTINPNLEVVRTNEQEGRVILRDRHSGKQFSIAIDAARRGSMTLKADDDENSGSVEIGRDAKLPSWVPEYPGSHPTPGFSAKGETARDAGEAGAFSFRTIDDVSKVVEFYREKGREMGLTAHVGPVGTVIIGEKERDRYVKVVAVAGSDETVVNVVYARKL